MVIYYLAQAYTQNPSQAFHDAQKWALDLMSKGYTVFSPITHSHPIETYRLNHGQFYCKKCSKPITTEGAAEGSALCECSDYEVELKGDGITIDQIYVQEGLTEYCLDYPLMPDYVQLDLNLLESMLVDPPDCGAEIQGYARGGGSHDGCIGCDFWNDRGVQGNCELDKWKQPNLVILFAPTCFKEEPMTPTDKGLMLDRGMAVSINNHAVGWGSKGAEQEFLWAKSHNVECRLLDPFLREGKEVRI